MTEDPATARDDGTRVILIVEDTVPIADLIRQTLNEERHYQAITATNGALALEALRGVRADLVILDVMLPGLSGLELYQRLQQNDGTRGIPAIFITADPAALGALRDQGHPYVLPKPFDLDDLLDMVERALGNT